MGFKNGISFVVFFFQRFLNIQNILDKFKQHYNHFRFVFQSSERMYIQ